MIVDKKPENQLCDMIDVFDLVQGGEMEASVHRPPKGWCRVEEAQKVVDQLTELLWSAQLEMTTVANEAKATIDDIINRCDHIRSAADLL